MLARGSEREEIMIEDEAGLIMFLIVGCLVLGAFGGSYFQLFGVPSCKIWESNRTYDKILIADDVICKPGAELNTTYWRYDTAIYNGTEYLVQKVQTTNSTAKGIVVCRDAPQPPITKPFHPDHDGGT